MALFLLRRAGRLLEHDASNDRTPYVELCRVVACVGETIASRFGYNMEEVWSL